MKDFMQWIEKSKVNLLYIVVGILVSIIIMDMMKVKVPYVNTEVKTEVVKPKNVLQEVIDVDAKCSPQKAEIVLNGSDLLDKRQFVVLDLSTFEKNIEVKGGYEYTRYRRYGNQKEYYTVQKKHFIKVEKK